MIQISLHFLLITALHLVPISYDWITHELKVLFSPVSQAEEHRRWSEFLSFASVTFFIGGTYTWSEVNLVNAGRLDLARVALGFVLIVVGFFGIAGKSVIERQRSNTLTNRLESHHPRLRGRGGLIYRSTLVALIALLVISRDFWVESLAVFMTF
jgi:hypothetical protein